MVGVSLKLLSLAGGEGFIHSQEVDAPILYKLKQVGLILMHVDGEERLLEKIS